MYCIDLDTKHPEVLNYTKDIMNEDIEFHGVKRWQDLNNCDYDRRVFNSLEDAEKFLDLYMRTLKGLKNKDICKSRALPAMLYKRRYIVLSLLGLKNQTYRSYLKKNWSVGDLVNLHDQVNFLTVRITKITKIEEDVYKYDFKIEN